MSSLKDFQTFLATVVGEDFALATEHPYDCICDKCREWWVQMGPEDGTFGPFGDELWNDFAAALSTTVEEARGMHREEIEKDE